MSNLNLDSLLKLGFINRGYRCGMCGEWLNWLDTTGAGHKCRIIPVNVSDSAEVNISITKECANCRTRNSFMNTFCYACGERLIMGGGV